MDGKAPPFHSSGSFFSQPGRQVGMVRMLALTVHSARQGTGAMLEALQQYIFQYIFLAEQTTFTAAFLNSSLVQQLKYTALNEQHEL